VDKFLANYEGRAPRVEVEGKEATAYVKSIGDGFDYSIQDIRAAVKAGVPLDQMKAVIAKRAIDEKLNTIAMLGDAEQNMLGLLNQTGTLTYTVPNDGTGATTTWSTKTGAQMARDVIGLIDAIPAGTAEVERAKRVIMPYTSFRLLSATLYNVVYPSISALDYIQKQRPGVEIRGALLTDTAGAGSTKLFCDLFCYHAF
jgi:hypothetical protein